MEDMKAIEARGENVLLLGDMNRAIGAGQWGVEGNKPNISCGGQLLRDLLATEKYVLLNGLFLAQGGPWTWVDRSNGEELSQSGYCVGRAGAICYNCPCRQGTRFYSYEGEEDEEEGDQLLLGPFLTGSYLHWAPEGWKSREGG